MLFTGKTVEEAIENGLTSLQLPRMKAHIRVLSREKRGFLGFGKKLAQVDIEPIDSTTANKADQQAIKGVPDAINEQNAPVKSHLENTIELSKVTSAIKKMEEDGQPLDQAFKEKLLEGKALPQEFFETEIRTSKSEQSFEEFVATEFVERPSANLEKAAQDVCDYVTNIIYEMDLEATTKLSYNRRQINLQIDTQEPGRIIGYHGKVLKSLQLLAQNFLHDHYSRHFSVSINVRDYLEHRAETLIDFTTRISERVIESGRDYIMDPMSNTERKIVHKTVSQIEGVESYSEGQDPHRYVVIAKLND